MQKFFTLFLILCSSLYLQAQNIGIGTPSPDYTLDVNGQLGITSVMALTI